MLRQYDGVGFRYLLHAALQAGRGGPSKINTILLAIRQTATIVRISPRAPRLLSVTESFVLPPQPEGGQMPKSPTFNIREWLVPPVLLPVFLVLLIAAVIVVQ